MPLIAVLVSLVAALLITLSGRRPNLRETWTVMAALAKFAIVLAMLPGVLAGKVPEMTLFTISPSVSLALRVDSAGLIFGLLASLLWIFTSFYSIGYVRSLSEHKQTRYFASFAVCLSATIGIAFSANLLTFFIFYEILTIATYPLVIHKETPTAIAAGRKYLAYLLTSGAVLLLAVVMTHWLADSLTFIPGGFLSAEMGEGGLLLLFILFLIGFGAKAGVMPLHSWLPTAMAAPTPVSALLHAVAVVKAGAFGFIRVSGFVFSPQLLQEIGAANLTALIAGVTILLASLMALRQDNLKRRLAYSTIGHLSYIVLGLVLLAPGALEGGIFHVVTHAVMKITLFFGAGAIYVRTHLENVSQLDGIGRQMPITMGAFALAAMGLAGIPPLSGFVSKWYLAQGTLEAGYPVLLGLLLLSGLLNAGYLFPVVTRAFFGRSDNFTKFSEAPLFMVVPLAFTAALSLFLGIMPDGIFHFFELVSDVTSKVLGGGG